MLDDMICASGGLGCLVLTDGVSSGLEGIGVLVAALFGCVLLVGVLGGRNVSF